MRSHPACCPAPLPFSRTSQLQLCLSPTKYKVDHKKYYAEVLLHAYG